MMFFLSVGISQQRDQEQEGGAANDSHLRPLNSLHDDQTTLTRAHRKITGITGAICPHEPDARSLVPTCLGPLFREPDSINTPSHKSSRVASCQPSALSSQWRIGARRFCVKR